MGAIDGFTNNLEEVGPLGWLLTVVLQILFNSAIIWVVVNYMVTVEGAQKEKFSRCIYCTVMLTVVAVIAFLCLALIPIGLLSLIIALFVAYKGSMAVIEASFERTSGGLTILIMYYVVSLAIAATLSAMGV
jgi:hypothetical protein